MINCEAAGIESQRLLITIDVLLQPSLTPRTGRQRAINKFLNPSFVFLEFSSMHRLSLQSLLVVRGGFTGESGMRSVPSSSRSPTPWRAAGSGVDRRDAWGDGSGAPLGTAGVAGAAVRCSRRWMRLLLG